MSLTAINEERQSERLGVEQRQALWASRRSWAKEYVQPAIELALNGAYLKTLIGEIKESAYEDIGGEEVALGAKGSSFGTSLTMLHGAMVGRTVYANPSAMANFQFICGITGRCSDPSGNYDSVKGYKEFSLGFSGSYYYSISRGGNSTRSSGNTVYVGLPGPDDDPTKWFAARIRKYFEYWVAHCTSTPSHPARSNEHYNDKYYFNWPEAF